MISSKFNGRRLYYSAHEGVYQDTLPLSDMDGEMIQRVLTTPIKRRSKDSIIMWLAAIAGAITIGLAFLPKEAAAQVVPNTNGEMLVMPGTAGTTTEGYAHAWVRNLHRGQSTTMQFVVEGCARGHGLFSFQVQGAPSATEAAPWCVGCGTIGDAIAVSVCVASAGGAW